MHEVRRRFLLNALKLFDLTLVVLSFGAASALAAYADKRFSLAEFFSIRVKLSNCLIFAAMLVVWHTIFALCGLYRSRRLSTDRAEINDVLTSVALCTVVLAIGAAILPITMITVRFLILFWAVSTILMTSARIALRKSLGQVRLRGRNLRHVLVVGTNVRAVTYARKILQDPERGYRLLGFVDHQWDQLEDFKRTGFPLLSDYEGLAEFLRRNVVDEVALYLPLRSHFKLAFQVAELCEQHGILMRFDGDIFGLKTAHARAEELDGDNYVATYTGVRDWWPLVIKRALDIAASAVLLALLAPLFAVVALFIWMTSRGPIFYRQERIGLNKRRFRIYKFRTMVMNADRLMAQLEQHNEVSGPVFKIKNDPRITPIGRFLRRSSIDELPQLLNVLKGEMSLVGPRPLPVRDYEGFNEDWQRRRFSVRPGITCLWQINGRSGIPFEQWMELDLQYMDEWSLWLDLKILARTIPAVMKGSGAA
jgi:exopolysaccharide biosynthesis polyprenyl glycosylphosphotransferase